MIDGNNPEHITLYVSRWGGNDNNDGLSESTPLRNIQTAINKFPKFNVGDRRIRIAPGDYEESVEIKDFIGGEISLSSINRKYKPVINEIDADNCSKLRISRINTSSKIREGLLIGNCAFVDIEDVILDSNGYGIEISHCPHAEIASSEINSHICGIQVSDSTLRVSNTTIKNGDFGIRSSSSLVFSAYNTISSDTKYKTNISQIIE